MPITNDELKRKLEESLPLVSKNYLLDYLYTPKQPWEKNLTVPQLVLEALKKIPCNGRIRYQKHLFALRSVQMLIQEIPKNTPGLPEIMKLYQERLVWYDKYH